jgi:hypothetical protein
MRWAASTQAALFSMEVLGIPLTLRAFMLLMAAPCGVLSCTAHHMHSVLTVIGLSSFETRSMGNWLQHVHQ